MYERRIAIIKGDIAPTEEEIEAGEKQSAKDDEEYTPLPKDAAAPCAIPEFWLTALQNHIGLQDLITERDAGALKHLVDIRLSYLDNLSQLDAKPGFKITFAFSPNEFFENETLEKTYYYQAEVGYFGDFAYDRAVGTEIKWKEDKDLTKEFEIKKQRNKSVYLCVPHCLSLLTLSYLSQTRTELVSFAKRGPQNRFSISFPHRRHPVRMLLQAAT